MPNHFTHLHLHTDFSLLDGAISIERLVEFGKKNDFKSLAITDHGNIFGAVKFFQKCKKEGIKPILGMEAYFCEDAKIKNIEKKYYHLILLVQNEVGYKNLLKLISYSYQEGFYFKPRIDYEALQKYNEGLMVTTACLGGHIPTLLMQGNEDAAQECINWFLNVFGPDRFYLEVQPEDQKEQAILNKKLFEYAKKNNLPVVAAGDCHYPSADDHEAHEIMLSVQTHDKISNPDRYTFGDCRVYMRTTQEMLEIFKDNQQAVWNAGIIADQCTFDFQTGKLFFPNFEIPSQYTTDNYFKYMCVEGFQKLLDNNRFDKGEEALYKKRLEVEMDLIIKMGFVGYFLVVGDFIQWARANGIPVGPGRGSAAGSLVAWALQITNIDPIKYNLLFERFLNPERISMPDIDIDFCIEGRDKVINYVRSKYGQDKVCQIITFGTMMAKGVIKDVARVLGFAFEDSNAITNLIPDQLKITLQEALAQEPRLKELIETNPKAKKLFDIALRLEGLTRHASKHAAGIVISPEPVDHVLPIYVPPKSTELVTQYAMTELESLGFLKIDLLGLKNLTLIDKTIAVIKKNYQKYIDIDKIPLDDRKTFELLGQGKTSGVFQLESDGLKEVLRKLQPDKFEDIIAVNALYRPGPLGSGMVEDFIERRHGRAPIRYLFNELEPILQETYGVIVYQEQVIKIASVIGGFSLGEADILRRAMGKKKAEEMAKQQIIFVERATKNGFDSPKAKELFDLMAYFAGYGFNKSHSAAYALIAYQTAYLKAHYPAEFMACLISLEVANAENMAFYLQEARDMGIEILPPDINRSSIEFSPSGDGKIMFGLQGIKNVGMAALENILTVRNSGVFKSLVDFCKRVDLRTSNKRVLEHLIYSGAFDNLAGTRAQKIHDLEKIIDVCVEYKKKCATGQMDLFGNPLSDNGSDELEFTFQNIADWPDKEKLEKEKEAIGFYLSAHPLAAYKKILSWCSIESFGDLLKKNTNDISQEITVMGAGLVKSKREIFTKKGDRMAFIALEDATSSAEIILFPSVYKQVETVVSSYNIFMVKGVLDATSPNKCKIKANNFVPLELLFQELPITKISLQFPNDYNFQNLSQIKTLFSSGNITLEFLFYENNSLLRLTSSQKISLNLEGLQQLDAQNVSIRCQL